MEKKLAEFKYEGNFMGVTFSAKEGEIIPAEVAAAYANLKASEALDKISSELERLNDILCDIDWPQPPKT
ncbi:hypothetical protein [Sphingomicrobium aestuariivivum]|uniref:hypothetical protein n=1 Tax=Sphingomicrobium aestuariivivum TaxID=1582356 RepID=UPI001FD6BE63|nr:hypothetical protein [Sphingomicrobium aestuariivivum]MCJ8191974.1 hypothetical protein [Sphingomicrobium aestuariivivum]